MKTEVFEVKKITASDGMIVTNGEIYGKVIYPAENLNDEDFYEITESEYEKLTSEEEEN